MTDAERRGYANPVRAGVCLGLLLFAVILVAGRGLGASGAFASGAAAAVNAVAPKAAAITPIHRGMDSEDVAGSSGNGSVLELVGVAVGAWRSARLAGRIALPSSESATRRPAAASRHALAGG